MTASFVFLGDYLPILQARAFSVRSRVLTSFLLFTSFMRSCVGVPQAVPMQELKTVVVGTRMISVLQRFCVENNIDLQMRIGIHTCSNVIAGLMGEEKLIFGTTFDLMACFGHPNSIHMTFKA